MRARRAVETSAAFRGERRAVLRGRRLRTSPRRIRAARSPCAGAAVSANLVRGRTCARWQRGGGGRGAGRPPLKIKTETARGAARTARGRFRGGEARSPSARGGEGAGTPREGRVRIGGSALPWTTLPTSRSSFRLSYRR